MNKESRTRRRRARTIMVSSSLSSSFSVDDGFNKTMKRRSRRRKKSTQLQSMISPIIITTTSTTTTNSLDPIISMLQNAILDERSTAIAIASPLFALSVVPYLLFLKNLWRAETATSEQRYAFATLLVFVLISIPAEVYTKERYDTVLSNIDSLHFLIQSAISLTNLRILLAFRDDFDLTTSTSSSTTTTTTTTTTQLTAADIGRPGAAVEAVAGVILLSTGILMALDDRLIDLSSIDFQATSETSVKFMGSVTLTIQNWRDYAQEFDSSFTITLYRFPRGAFTFFSLVEWLVAMGFVWDYGTRTQHRGWKLLTLAMLPLHASGICAVTQHFFNNDPSLEWLVALQGAFTMGGNISLLYAAKVLANEEPRLDMMIKKTGRRRKPRKEKAQIEIWDVERLGLLFEKDDEFAFSFKIALVSVGIAAFVRGASLVFSPEFDYNSLSSSSSSNHHDELNAYALLFVFIPLLINYVKWHLRFRAEEEESARLRIGGGRR
ncbi:unnamed protein product [Bathycoccus prasinos]